MNSYLRQNKKVLFINFFLSLNIPDFSLAFAEKLQPSLKKVTLYFPATRSKNWGPVKPPLLFENLVKDSTLSLPQAERGGARYEFYIE